MNSLSNRLLICCDLTTRQPLWAILCLPQERGRKGIEEQSRVNEREIQVRLRELKANVSGQKNKLKHAITPPVGLTRPEMPSKDVIKSNDVHSGN